MKEAGFPPEDLRLWHVLALPKDENDVYESLKNLSYKKRPRPKTRELITCGKRPSAHPPCEAMVHDDSESCEEHEMAKADGALTEEAQQGPPEMDFISSFPEEICVTRTFLDVSKRERVGWSPRTVCTKSSNDRHSIENPR